MHACLHACLHACMHACMPSYLPAYPYTYPRTYLPPYCGEVGAGLRRKLGHEPSAIMVSSVMEALDLDASGSISRAEFERREGWHLSPH